MVFFPCSLVSEIDSQALCISERSAHADVETMDKTFLKNGRERNIHSTTLSVILASFGDAAPDLDIGAIGIGHTSSTPASDGLWDKEHIVVIAVSQEGAVGAVGAAHLCIHSHALRVAWVFQKREVAGLFFGIDLPGVGVEIVKSATVDVVQDDFLHLDDEVVQGLGLANGELQGGTRMGEMEMHLVVYGSGGLCGNKQVFLLFRIFIHHKIEERIIWRTIHVVSIFAIVSRIGLV